MKKLLKIGAFSFIALLFSCTKLNTINIDDVEPAMQYKWAKALVGTSEEDEIDAVTSDTQGNVYISGKFEEVLTIEGQNENISSKGKADIMLVKYDKEGNWKWTRQFGGQQEDNIFDAACDKHGNVILSGYFQGVVQFGKFTLTSKGGFDMIILKVSPKGTVLWAKNYGGTGHDGGNEVVISPDNRILVGAQSNGTFEGITNTGNQDAYLLSIDEDGNIEWIQGIKGAGDARAKAIGVDNIGNVYIGGDFMNQTYIENNGEKIEFVEYGNRDAYLASFTPQGSLRWNKTWGSNGVDFCKGIVVTSQNKLYAVGQFQNTVSFNNDILTSANDTKDLFIWKVLDTGDTEWLRHVSSTEKLSGAEVAIDAHDNLIFGLGITGTTNFQTSTTKVVSIPSCEGVRCPVLIKYHKDGEGIDYLIADQSYNGRFGEIAFSNNTAYIDCEITGGTYTFGNDIITPKNNTKDAVLVAIKL